MLWTVNFFANLLIALLFLFMVPSNCTSFDTEHPSDKTLKTSKCDYLERQDDSQDNAFVMNNLLCCMCPAGYRYALICNASHPNTTTCEKCSSGTYIHYGPHLQEHCFVKKKIDCPAGKVYYAGTTEEEDRCICEPGSIERGKWCVPVKTTNEKKPVTDKTPTTTTTTSTSELKTTFHNGPSGSTTEAESIVMREASDQPVHTLSEISDQRTVSELKDPLLKRITTTSTTLYDSGSKEPNEAGDGGNTTLVIVICLVCGVVILLVCGIIVCLCKKKCHTEPAEYEDKNMNNGSYEVSSATTHESYRSLLESDERHSDQMDARSVQCDIQVTSEEPDASNSVTTILHAPQHNREEADDLNQQRSTQKPVLVQSRTNHGDHDRGIYKNAVQELQDSPRTIPYNQRELEERNERFARTLAQRFGKALPKSDILELFRVILDGDSNEQELKNIYDKNIFNPKEIIHDMMTHTLHRKGGRVLTPEYFLNKVNGLGFKRLAEIVEEEMAALTHDTSNQCAVTR